LAEGEAEKIADYLGLAFDAFLEQYTQLLPDRSGLGLISRPNHECIFLEGRNVCKIQAVKPRQCAGFPNTWNFPDWRKVCEAIPVMKKGSPHAASL
jgi:Fe-S-cluster containining protein